MKDRFNLWMELFCTFAIISILFAIVYEVSLQPEEHILTSKLVIALLIVVGLTYSTNYFHKKYQEEK